MRGAMRTPTPHRIAAALRPLIKHRRGNVAVEFGLGAPVLFLIIFGVVELGYALWLQNALDESVAAAARCASISSTACTGPGVPTYAANESGAPVTSSAFTNSCRSTDLCANKPVTCGCQVAASYSMALAIPWTSLSVNLMAHAIEQLAA